MPGHNHVLQAPNERWVWYKHTTLGFAYDLNPTEFNVSPPLLAEFASNVYLHWVCIHYKKDHVTIRENAAVYDFGMTRLVRPSPAPRRSTRASLRSGGLDPKSVFLGLKWKLLTRVRSALRGPP